MSLSPPAAPWPPLSVPAPPAALRRLDLSSCFQAGAAAAAAGGKHAALPSARSRTSTATTFPPSSDGGPSDGSGSEDEAATTAPLGADRALPRVESSLVRRLRVRKTFFELQPEPEEDACLPRRRPRSAPPLGRGDEAAEQVAYPVEAVASASSAAAGCTTVDGLPSIGSRLHASGECKPCAFLHTKGCENGPLCDFCHACDENEMKRRQKARWEEKRAAWRQWRKQERRKVAAQRQHPPAAFCR